MKNTAFNHTHVFIALMISIFSYGFCSAQSETVKVSPFKKVVISPYIEVAFKQSEEESVVINSLKAEREKINIEVNGKTLRVYLDDAKIVSKDETIKDNGKKRRRQIYQGTEASITINYKQLRDAEIRGAERIDFPDAINTEDFDLELYGSPKVYLKRITAEKLKVALYGESYLEIKDGTVDFQCYRCYGTSEVNAISLNSAKTKIAAYGSTQITVNVSAKLKVSAFGDAKIRYTGNAKLNNGLRIGDTTIQKIDL